MNQIIEDDGSISYIDTAPSTIGTTDGMTKIVEDDGSIVYVRT